MWVLLLELRLLLETLINIWAEFPELVGRTSRYHSHGHGTSNADDRCLARGTAL
jgi:hypothetical protein